MTGVGCVERGDGMFLLIWKAYSPYRSSYVYLRENQAVLQDMVQQ